MLQNNAPLKLLTDKPWPNLREIENANLMLAEPLYLAGYIERIGTGTTDIISKCLVVGLREPEFIQAEDFRAIVYRSSTDHVTPQDTPQDTPQVTPQVEQLIAVLDGVSSRDELQEKLELKDREHFRKSYINEALKLEVIEMTIPDKPNSRNQKYRLTPKGKALKEQLNKKK